MQVKINCVDNKEGAYCKNKNIKRSLFGLGSRCCVEFHDDKECKFKVKNEKISPPPPPMKHTN